MASKLAIATNRRATRLVWVLARLLAIAAIGGVVSWPATARASDCAASRYTAGATTRDAAILEAGQLAAAGRYADARAAYLDLLSRNEDDSEALYGLARVDAWQGCAMLAESEYTRVLVAHPRDADVRAGLVDLFVWNDRYDEASRMIDEGLALDPRSPALLARKARMLAWKGEAVEAARMADEAVSLAPDDGDLAAMRARMFVGEARVAGRLDLYPPGYQDLYALGGQVLGRVRRFELYGGIQALERYGGATSRPVLDARYPFGLLYHPALGVTLGAEIAPGLPANAIPDVAIKTFANVPVAHRTSAYLAYSFWHFGGGELVNILNPSVEVTLPRDVRVTVRGWLSAVTLPRPSPQTADTKIAGALGPAAAWDVTPRVTVGAWYTYGTELDQNPALFQLLAFRSHQVGTFGEVLFNRFQGVRPLVQVARREATSSGVSIWTISFELGAWLRW